MIKTILRNLINNAIKFSYRNNRIVLSGKRKVERVELRVTDFGTGIDETRQKKIFDLGSNVHTPGTENEEGSGFGLKLVIELIRKNKGTILVESEPGKGSSFCVSLPALL
jgi:signal transduction histidine kinase